MSEQFYTIQEIAERWRVDPEKVTRIIQNEPGVLDLGTPANIKKRKRAYRILRVPLAVLTRVERKRAK